MGGKCQNNNLPTVSTEIQLLSKFRLWAGLQICPLSGRTAGVQIPAQVAHVDIETEVFLLINWLAINHFLATKGLLF